MTDIKFIWNKSFVPELVVIGKLIPPKSDNYYLPRKSLKDPLYPAWWTVEVLCPFCGEIHIHGWPPPGKPVDPRIRMATCKDAPRIFPCYVIYLEGEAKE